MTIPMMRSVQWVLLAALLVPLPLPAQTERETEEKRLSEIQAKRARGEQPSAEDQEFFKTVQARRREEFARDNPPRESTGLVPLPDLGNGTHKGSPIFRHGSMRDTHSLR